MAQKDPWNSDKSDSCRLCCTFGRQSSGYCALILSHVVLLLVTRVTLIMHSSCTAVAASSSSRTFICIPFDTTYYPTTRVVHGQHVSTQQQRQLLLLLYRYNNRIHLARAFVEKLSTKGAASCRIHHTLSVWAIEAQVSNAHPPGRICVYHTAVFIILLD